MTNLPTKHYINYTSIVGKSLISELAGSLISELAGENVNISLQNCCKL